MLGLNTHENADEVERVRQKLLNMVQLATLEVSSFVAELECEVHRADEVQDRLKDVQFIRSMSQTILAIVIGSFIDAITGGSILRQAPSMSFPSREERSARAGSTMRTIFIFEKPCCSNWSRSFN